MQFESTKQATAPLRPVTIGSAPVLIHQSTDGSWHLRSSEALRPYPERLSDCLVHGAEHYPDRLFVAQRGADGEWIRLSYAQMLQRARVIGQALLDRQLSAERPLLILSGNDLQHMQLAMGALYAGVPFCPVSPAYSLLAQEYSKLAGLVQLLTPGLVYAADGSAFNSAIQSVITQDTEILLGQGSITGRNSQTFSSLLDTQPHSVDAANAAITPEHIAKFLFTSGSTKRPKAVITTQRMLCSNQQMLLQTFPCFGEEPPVLVDWLPWNHTFGGSHNVGIALYNGGSYYIDDGKPTAKDFAKTLANLREIAPTVFFNVPKGWELLTEALEADSALRQTFFSRMKLFFFAGAGLSQAAWDRLEHVSAQACGERIRIMAGLGMTETAPSCTFTTGPIMMAGYIGLPAPGCEAKLVPVEGKLEARFTGPHVMPGYWRAPEATAEVFDEQGYYCTGDAVRFFDATRPEIGLMFDGRITEDFKLSSGTFVSVGPLRARVISQGAPYIQDVVVAGLNRNDIGLLIFPRLENCARLAKLAEHSPAREILQAPALREYFQTLLAQLNQAASGSSTRIARLRLLEEPPSIDHGEITDKGSINQRAVLTRRAELIEALYAENDSQVIYAV